MQMGAGGRTALSRREREVAALVAEGLTDREIAKRLFISERTAESHVLQIRNKLGFDNRAQVASWFTRQSIASSSLPAAPAAAPVVRNLPSQLTRFIGRDRELGEIRRLLQRSRLLTITGAGGCGKTRLAVEAVSEVIHRYPDGAWFVDLSALTDPATIPQALAATLGIRERDDADVLGSIAAELRTTRCRAQCLLILDNCEHVIDGCASAATTLLTACPQLAMLCTSREPLHVPGETIWSLAPLPLPAADHARSADAVGRAEAVQLFVDRAVLSDPAFELDDANAPTVLRVCQQLDGIPLALELAAARLALTPIDALLALLQGSFTRLRRRGVPGRQQTMRAAIDWSYALLPEPEQRLHRRLAVFRGGFTLEAAGAVCEDGDAFALLEALQDKSLVVRVMERQERFRLLEPIRQYALERLTESGELEAMRGRHLAFFATLAERGGHELTGPSQAVWLGRLSDDHDNLRAALERSRGAGEEQRVRLVLALNRFWRVLGHVTEGRAWLEEVVAANGPATGDRARALNAAAGLAWLQGDVARARTLVEASLATWREVGDTDGVQGSLANLGAMAATQSDWEAAQAFLEESLALARCRGDELTVGIVLGNLGVLAAHLDQHGLAHERLAESERVMHRLGDAARVANALANRGLLAVRRGRAAEAAEHYAASLRIQGTLREPQSLAECLEGVAWIASHAGRQEPAVRLGGAAASVRRSLGAPHRPWSRRVVDEWLEAARDTLGDAAGEAWAEGEALTIPEAMALAASECELALRQT
jgi:predicted ATPase/DNA-binding CsgD family transcriptional regulator